jgi:tRNA threonylcarbamoyladenosine biosynthesis protein TsaE
MTLEIVTRSSEDTRSLGARIGSLLRAGDVVSLSGDLGAGKTVFAKGLAAALGVHDDVVSPTFTLVREYSGVSVPFVHIDVYRLDRFQELHDLGFDELVSGSTVTVVEWGDRISALLPVERLDVMLQFGESDDDRVVSITPAGNVWAVRCDALAAVLDDSGPDLAAGAQ